MRIETFGKDVEVTPALQSYVEEKLARIGKHFDQHCEARVTLKLQKTEHHVDASLNIPGQTLHAEANAQTMYAAIDLLADKRPPGDQAQGEKQQHAPLPVGDNGG